MQVKTHYKNTKNENQELLAEKIIVLDISSEYQRLPISMTKHNVTTKDSNIKNTAQNRHSVLKEPSEENDKDDIEV